MKLILATPADVLVKQDVKKVLAEGTHGSFCLLPRHVDFFAVLVPGLLGWEGRDGDEQFAAVSEAILVKRSGGVFVSAARATQGSDLTELAAIVRDQFTELDERQRAAHAASAKLEASFLRRSLDFADQQQYAASELA